MSTGEPKIAIIHDELTRRGGAEVVLEELIRIYPNADVYSLYAGRPLLRVDGTDYPVHTSFLQKFPLWFRRHPRRLLPLLSYAAEQFDFSNYDLVISSSSGFAKAIITRSNVPHLCYCHTPTRYLWDSTHDVLRRAGITGWSGRFLLHYLRMVDYATAQRVDVYLANSEYTARRLKLYYRRRSTVVYPPINTGFYTPLRPSSYGGQAPYFLCVGRLTPTKRFDQAIRVCEKLELPLIIVGSGGDRGRLQRLAGRYTRLVGSVSDTQLRDYYRGARALLQPGSEDFGMTSVEAMACGTPVIALSHGGAAEVVVPSLTGMLYTQPQEEALAEAIRVFLERERHFEPGLLQRQALRFDRALFREAICAPVNRLLESRQNL